jgi:UbiD family decarboxylase
VVLKVDIKRLAVMDVSPEIFRKKIGDLIFATKAGLTIHRLVLVGEDIDVYDFKDVVYALSI